MKKEDSGLEDERLIEQSLLGNKEALESLIKKHQEWVYNVAINLTGETEEALDLMQETLIKVITNLSKFECKSQFRTWAYRIIKNHFLNTQRFQNYHQTIPWEAFGDGLDSIIDENLHDSPKIEKDLLIEEAKLSCMKGMLLCLTPEQRLIYVMGELFETPDSMASEVMEISKANFRKKLSRAREQLYGFMNNKCGLINKANPCRCAKKTVGFIKKGYVNPENLQFQKNVISRISEVAKGKLDDFESDGKEAYRKLYQSHYYQKPKNRLSSLKKILDSEVVRKTFEI
ncbi:MAG: RNA polymerase sigma factor [Cyclobacteriaceae bacterium]